MSKARLKYLRTEVIEDITAQRIRDYEAKVGVAVALPVPLDQIVEQVLGLDFDWNVIEEQPGEQILGGLDAANRKILLNEVHSDLFDDKPGLVRSTIGHEADHWDFDVDQAPAGTQSSQTGQSQSKTTKQCCCSIGVRRIEGGFSDGQSLSETKRCREVPDPEVCPRDAGLHDLSAHLVRTA